MNALDMLVEWRNGYLGRHSLDPESEEGRDVHFTLSMKSARFPLWGVIMFTPEWIEVGQGDTAEGAAREAIWCAERRERSEAK